MLKLKSLIVIFLMFGALHAITFDQIIDSMEFVHYKKIQTITSDIQQMVKIADMESTQKMTGTMVMKSPDKFYIEYSNPEKQTVVTDGKKVWFYVESTKQVIVQDVKDIKQKDNIFFNFGSFIKTLKEDYDSIVLKGEKVNSRRTVCFESKPKSAESEFTKIAFWIDRELWLPVRITVFFNETSTITVDFNNIKVNEDVDDSKFNFKVTNEMSVISSPLQ